MNTTSPSVTRCNIRENFLNVYIAKMQRLLKNFFGLWYDIIKKSLIINGLITNGNRERLLQCVPMRSLLISPWQIWLRGEKCYVVGWWWSNRIMPWPPSPRCQKLGQICFRCDIRKNPTCWGENYDKENQVKDDSLSSTFCECHMFLVTDQK